MKSNVSKMKNNTISQGVIDMTGRGGIKAFFYKYNI